ncbi:MAG: hypothetical protein ACLROA_12975 [Turicibacter sp.]
MDTYLSTSHNRKKYFNPYNDGIRLSIYEFNNGLPTGYKVYVDDDQVATIEFRNQEWIVGILIGFSIKVRTFRDFELAYQWIKINVT